MQQKYPRLGPFRVSDELAKAFVMLCDLWELTPSDTFRKMLRRVLRDEYIEVTQENDKRSTQIPSECIK